MLQRRRFRISAFKPKKTRVLLGRDTGLPRMYKSHSLQYVPNDFGECIRFDKMMSRYLLLLTVAWLLVVHVYATTPSTISEKTLLPLHNSRATDGKLVRYKRAAFVKLPLLGGAALIGKTALLVGGAVVGVKALLGAGIVGAGLFKAKHYAGGYGGEHASYDYAPTSSFSYKAYAHSVEHEGWQ